MSERLSSYNRSFIESCRRQTRRKVSINLISGYRIEQRNKTSWLIRIAVLALSFPNYLNLKVRSFSFFSAFSLRTFEIFGCFNVSAAAIKRLGQKCLHLETLNLGQCYKVGNTMFYCLHNKALLFKLQCSVVQITMSIV